MLAGPQHLSVRASAIWRADKAMSVFHQHIQKDVVSFHNDFSQHFQFLQHMSVLQQHIQKDFVVCSNDCSQHCRFLQHNL
jgi:hypothetical protein